MDDTKNCYQSFKAMQKAKFEKQNNHWLNVFMNKYMTVSGNAQENELDSLYNNARKRRGLTRAWRVNCPITLSN